MIEIPNLSLNIVKVLENNEGNREKKMIKGGRHKSVINVVRNIKSQHFYFQKRVFKS